MDSSEQFWLPYPQHVSPWSHQRCRQNATPCGVLVRLSGLLRRPRSRLRLVCGRFPPPGATKGTRPPTPHHRKPDQKKNRGQISRIDDVVGVCELASKKDKSRPRLLGLFSGKVDMQTTNGICPAQSILAKTFHMPGSALSIKLSPRIRREEARGSRTRALCAPRCGQVGLFAYFGRCGISPLT